MSPFSIERLAPDRCDGRLYRGVRVWRGDDILGKIKIHGRIGRPRAGAWFSAGPSGVVVSTPLFGASIEGTHEHPSLVMAHLMTGWDDLTLRAFGHEARISASSILTAVFGPERRAEEVWNHERESIEVDCGGGSPHSFLCNVEIQRVIRYRGSRIFGFNTYAKIDLRPYGRAPAHAGKRGDGDCIWALSTVMDRIGEPSTPISRDELAGLVRKALSAYIERYVEAVERHGLGPKPEIDVLDPSDEEERIAKAISEIPEMPTWDRYTIEALKTWKPESFPSPDAALTYALLGLLSEIGEVAGVEKREFRDGVSHDDTTEALILELGDVCWYTAISLHEAMSQGILTADDLFGFMRRSGFARNDATLLMARIFPGAGLPMSMSPTLIGVRSFSVITLFRRNIEKLRSRQIRGTIKGKGDKR